MIALPPHREGNPRCHITVSKRPYIIMWSQVQNGLASGFLLANGLPGATGNKASAYDPGVGLRYQF